MSTTMTSVRIPCITLWRPWANWVALGWKPIETRLHDRFRGLRGKRIAIHAAQKFDPSAYMAAYPFLADQNRSQSKMLVDPDTAGRIVCTAMVDDTRWLDANDSARALIDCGSVRRFGLVLSDVRRLPRQLTSKIKGAQGQFSVEVPMEYAPEVAAVEFFR